MNITEFSIKHHVAVVILCIGLFILGPAAYQWMPRESFPDVVFPFIIVTTVLDGANPTDVEQSVTIPLETEMDSLEGLKEMRSVSTDSLSMVSLEFVPGVETEVALRRVRDAVDQAKPDISKDAEEPVVKEFTISSIPVLIYQITGRGQVAASELYELADKLEDELKLVPGVLDVDIFGGREREVIIEIDPDRLHYYLLSLAQVRAILEGTNRNVSAGTAESATNRIVMRVPGEFKDPGEIMNLVIGYVRGTPTYLKDVATARFDFEDEKTRARLYDFAAPDGLHGTDRYTEPLRSVSLHVKKRAGTNVLELTAAVEEIMRRHPTPPDVRIVKSLDDSKQVRMMVSDLENGIWTSLVLILVVIFVAIGARNAVLIATAVPFSMLMSFIVLHLMGETLNMIVLFSLILASGMLVDNAIVIVECIYRHRCMGKGPREAALVGTAEVFWPVVASTVTTLVAFFPMVFWPGVMGEFMSHLPVTIMVVLSCSLFVAVVINPTLAALWMRVKPGDEKTIDPDTRRPNYWLVVKYKPVLEFMLDRPGWTLTTALVMLVFIFALYGTFNLGVEFFPPVDPDNTVCSIKPPEGISVAESDRLAATMEARLFGAPGSGWSEPVRNLKFASVVVGLEEGLGGGFGQENAGPVRVQVEFVGREYRSEPSPETLQEMRRRIEGLDGSGTRVTYPLFGADFDVLRPQDGPPTGRPVSVDIFGDDLNQMSAMVTEMKRLIRNTPGTVKPTDDAVTAQPTLEWDVDRARAGVFGLEQATVSSALQIAVGGLKVGTFGHGDDEQDIKLRLPEQYRLDTSRLHNITIPLVSGASVPLASVASARLVPGPVTIKHLDKRRVLNAGAEVQPGIRNDADIRRRFQAQVARHPFPSGVTYGFGGAAQEQKAAQDFLNRAFLYALFLVTAVLVLQFNTITVPLIIMSAVVLSLMGVLLGLLVLQAPFGIIMTGIAVISLAGVVVNNAIVLLDAAMQFERRGESPREAVVSATMVRFRPVLLTAITTILGLVPMALKVGFDFRNLEWQYDTSSSQWWQSMSFSVGFGLLVATVLTLGIVPTLYVVCRRAQDRLGFRNPALAE